MRAYSPGMLTEMQFIFTMQNTLWHWPNLQGNLSRSMRDAILYVRHRSIGPMSGFIISYRDHDFAAKAQKAIEIDSPFIMRINNSDSHLPFIISLVEDRIRVRKFRWRSIVCLLFLQSFMQFWPLPLVANYDMEISHGNGCIDIVYTPPGQK